MREQITPDDIIAIFNQLELKDKTKSGYILKPTIDGFDVYEITNDRLEQYLTAEVLHKNVEKLEKL